MITLSKISRKKLEFDKKSKQIESDELRLKTLEQQLLLLQSRVAAESIPIVREFCELRVENLNKLHQHLADSSFKKKEKHQIIQLMIELAIGLQSVGDSRAEAFLLELGADTDKNKESGADPFKLALPKELPLEGKQEVKSLFRQLAKVYHPDKEPLEHLREEKTSRMKKISAAYENQDLYGLLKLEKEYQGPKDFSEDKMELYVKFINDRQKELKVFEGQLKKHGPLAPIYKYIYSQKVSGIEINIKNEVGRVAEKVQKEKELQQIFWDSTTLRNFFKS